MRMMTSEAKVRNLRNKSFILSLNMKFITYLVPGVRRQLTLVTRKQIINEGVPAVEHWVPHGSGRVANYSELLLHNQIKVTLLSLHYNTKIINNV